MKKALILIGILSLVTYKSQVYTPTGTVSTVTNGTTTNVGIGTSTPNEKLTVSGSHAGSTILLHSEGNGTDAGRADLMLWASEPGNSYTGVGISNNVKNYDPSVTPNNMVRINSARGGSYIRLLDNGINFNLMSSAGVKSQAMTILSNGYVGIGINNPQAKLDVNGEVRSTLSSNEGGRLSIINSSKTGSKVNTWSLYNMTGSYGDGLQFWSYAADGSSYGAKLTLFDNGNVGIGTTTPSTKLDVVGKSSFSDNMKVNAKIEAKEVKVTTTPTADFVFAEDYNLPKLEEVEKFVTEKKHLPEIASAKEMEKEGVNLGEFQIKLLQKIEELTLYSIEQNKQLKTQNEKILELEKQVEELKSKK